MLINLTNHPYNDWSDKQKLAAKSRYGYVVDISFPEIAPQLTKQKVLEISKHYAKLCIDELRDDSLNDKAVHIMGEMTFCYQVISMLKRQEIKCIASTSNRIVRELPNSTKEVIFNFVRFREY